MIHWNSADTDKNKIGVFTFACDLADVRYSQEKKMDIVYKSNENRTPNIIIK